MAHALVTVIVFTASAMMCDIPFFDEYVFEYVTRYITREVEIHQINNVHNENIEGLDEAIAGSIDQNEEEDDKVVAMRRVFRQCTSTNNVHDECPLCKEEIVDHHVRLGLFSTDAHVSVRVYVDSESRVRVDLIVPYIRVTISKVMQPFECMRCSTRMHAECACALVASGHMKCLHCTRSF
jgi:hypothetical protein